MTAQRLRPHDWAAVAAVAALLGALTALLFGRFALSAGLIAMVVISGMLARRWSRRHPGPMPHAVRWVLFLPRGAQSPDHLRAFLAPQRGERVLEIGPGVGIYALPIAAALAPDGALEALDVQAEMLADLAQRARAAGVRNITTRHGDAQSLPYPDATFDAVYLVEVLGEIPDPAAALRELRRVLKPAGRLVVGEAILDPDYVSLQTLRRLTDAAGFHFADKRGGWSAYFARFQAAA
jgi:SAM-dependent methyltransferase